MGRIVGDEWFCRKDSEMVRTIPFEILCDLSGHDCALIILYVSF